MNKTPLLALSLIALQPAFAEEINSNVIHNYTYVELGYGYLHDVGNGGFDGHGVIGGGSFEVRNFVLGVSGGYFVADDDFGVGADIDTWNLGGNIGYVVRLMENRFNIVPHSGVNYAEATVDVPSLGSATADSTSITPGIFLSYAINNRVSVNTGYTYTRDIDHDDLDAHGFGVGTRIALTERLGLNLGVNFAEGSGFTGASTTLSFHF